MAQDIKAVLRGEEGGEGFFAFRARPYDSDVMRCVPGLGIGVTSHYTLPKSIDTHLGGRTAMSGLRLVFWRVVGLVQRIHPHLG